VVPVRRVKAPTYQSALGPEVQACSPFPQDPTACLVRRELVRFHSPRGGTGTTLRRTTSRCSTLELPTSGRTPE